MPQHASCARSKQGAACASRTRHWLGTVHPSLPYHYHKIKGDRPKQAAQVRGWGHPEGAPTQGSGRATPRAGHPPVLYHWTWYIAEVLRYCEVLRCRLRPCTVFYGLTACILLTSPLLRRFSARSRFLDQRMPCIAPKIIVPATCSCTAVPVMCAHLHEYVNVFRVHLVANPPKAQQCCGTARQNCLTGILVCDSGL